MSSWVKFQDQAMHGCVGKENLMSCSHRAKIAENQTQVTQKAPQKEKIDKLDFIKTETFLHQKKLQGESEGNPQNEENICKSYF